MKILMLSSFYPPSLGGISVYVQSLTRELSKRGHQVAVCTIGREDLSKFEEEDGVNIYRLDSFFARIPFLFKDPSQKWHPPVQDWLVSKKLAQIIERENPNIVHTHDWILYSMLPLKNRFKIPLVHSIHDYGLFCPKRSMAFKENIICSNVSLKSCISCMSSSYGLLRVLPAYYGIVANRNKLKSVDRFIAVSDFVRELNQRYLSITDENIVTIPNFSVPDIVERSEDFPDDFMLFVGWLMPHKGIDVLIEAYQKLNTKTKLLAIGIEHSDYHYQSTENIVVLKNVPRPLVMEAMSKCRFTVFPSVWAEPFGLVAIEAMSHGKAVIASDIGGLRDIIVNGKTGILIPPNNSHKLADAISHLLQRPELASKMGLRGHDRFVKKYTAESVVPKIIDVYEALL